jgi:hypothetical protein
VSHILNPSSILSSGATVGGFAIPLVLDVSSSQVEAVNSTSPVVLYTYTVPAGVMGTGRQLLLTIDGDYLNNSGGTLATSETLTFTLGATTIWSDTGKLHATSSNRKPLQFIARITNVGAANVQVLGGFITLGGSPSVTGIGEYGDDEVDANTAIGNTGLTIDTTAAQALALTVTHGQAASTISMRKNAATVVLL